MKKLHLCLVALPLLLTRPALAQGIFESGSVDAMSVGLGAGLAASLGRGALVRNTYQSAADAQMSAAEALQVRTKAIEQYMKLGCQYQAKKQWQNAEKSFRYVLQVSALRDGPGSPKMVPTLQHLVGVSHAQGNIYDAVGFQERIVGFAKNQKIPDPVSVISAEITLSNLYLEQKNYLKAEPILQESYGLSQKLPPEADAKRQVVIRTYAEVLRRLKKDELANSIAQPAITETKAAEPGPEVDTKLVVAGSPAKIITPGVAGTEPATSPTAEAKTAAAAADKNNETAAPPRP